MTPQAQSPNPEPAPVNPFANLEVKASGADPLPCGLYIATYKCVEAFTNDKVTGKLRWQWEVVSGTHKGRMASALTDSHLTPQTHAGRLISGLVGRPLVPGENVGTLWDDLTKAIGQRWAVMVASGPKGGKPSVQRPYGIFSRGNPGNPSG